MYHIAIYVTNFTCTCQPFWGCYGSNCEDCLMMAPVMWQNILETY